MSPGILVKPKFAIIDEKAQISVYGLPQYAAVTVDTFIIYSKTLYAGIGHFYADSGGKIEVGSQPSFGGTYQGVKPMGLFTSMVSLPSYNVGGRFLISGNCSEILTFHINVWKGHLTIDEIHRLHLPFDMFGTHRHVGPNCVTFHTDLFYENNFLCHTQLQRTYLDPSVTRTEIGAEQDDVLIRGTLFMPSGPGPFPAIIDSFGGVGGCVEVRAALLSRYGFAVLAVAYFDYKDLPYKTIFDYPMTYFDKAADWLLNQPRIAKHGIGMSGVCQGSQNALLTAMRNPKILAAVCISAPTLLMSDPIVDGNPYLSLVPPHGVVEPDDGTGLLELCDGKVQAKMGMCTVLTRNTLTYKHDNPILFIIGEEERSSHAKELVEQVRTQLTRSEKRNHWLEMIEGQGHLIEPPYSPMCTESRNPTASKRIPMSPKGDTWIYLNNLLTNWGGNRLIHEEGQEKAWNLMVEFFKKHLIPSKAKL